MNNKEKIELLKEFIKSSDKDSTNITADFKLPTELSKELSLHANILKVGTMEGALDLIRELERQEIQESQTEILEQQTQFTKILMLGTLVLAFSSFLQIYNVELDFNNSLFLKIILVITVVFLIITIIYIFITIFKSKLLSIWD